MAHLVIKEGGKERGVELEKSDILLGRSDESDIQILDEKCSRAHARIVAEGSGGYRIIDLESANGTKVNGKSTPQEILADGDRIGIGDCVIEFRADIASAAPEKAPGKIPPRNLVFTTGDRKGEPVPLRRASFLIGRSEDNDLPMPDNKYASVRHCEISFEDGRFFVTDLDSKTGTRVNGRKITLRPLEPGDVIGVGYAELEFVDPVRSGGTAAKYALFFTTGPGAGEEIPIESFPFTIGRHSSNSRSRRLPSI